MQVVTDELEQKFKPGVKFSIVDATEQLRCLRALKPLTRHDVAGAVMRTLVRMKVLHRDSKSFLFPEKKKKKVNGHHASTTKIKTGISRRPAS